MLKFTGLILTIALAASMAVAQTQSGQNTTAPAPAKTDYSVIGAPATRANVVLAAVRFGALDMTSDEAIDDFAMLEYCDIYTKYHPSEFDWRRVRAAMRKKIDLDKANYPGTLYLERPEAFGQYDFTAGMLLLAPSSVIHTRALLLATLGAETRCGNDKPKILPAKIVALLDKPLTLEGIELTEDEARAVTAGLDPSPNGNDQRLAYGRYTITFTGAEPTRVDGPALLDAKLDNVTLYQDSAYTRPFWSGQSSVRSLAQKQGSALDAIPFKGVDPVPEDGIAPKPLTAAPAPK